LIPRPCQLPSSSLRRCMHGSSLASSKWQSWLGIGDVKSRAQGGRRREGWDARMAGWNDFTLELWSYLHLEIIIWTLMGGTSFTVRRANGKIIFTVAAANG
jgi:hypothetical protein